MAKKCNYSTCNYDRFGGGYCKYHQYMRTDKKKPKPIKRTNIKHKRKATGEKEIMDEILNERTHLSFISNLGLIDYTSMIDFRYSCCAHVVPKNGTAQLTFVSKKLKDELLRLNKDNIVLLTPYEHHLYDNGTEELRQAYFNKMAAQGVFVDWNRLFKLREHIIDEVKKILNERKYY